MKLTLCFLLALLCPTRAAAQDEAQTYTRVGQAMPAFSFATLYGRKTSLEELKGEVVFVSFRATWCGPRDVEMPRTEREIRPVGYDEGDIAKMKGVIAKALAKKE